jgi:hypothetical protein
LFEAIQQLYETPLPIGNDHEIHSKHFEDVSWNHADSRTPYDHRCVGNASHEPHYFKGLRKVRDGVQHVYVVDVPNGNSHNLWREVRYFLCERLLNLPPKAQIQNADFMTSGLGCIGHITEPDGGSSKEVASEVAVDKKNTQSAISGCG